ncbi:MAG TPA: DUF5615 family PIN-like protein [Gammaproteobacteria bacterium]|nr:DUF5615 family PIN-like protein [Gammaproteobacteria bacterium]
MKLLVDMNLSPRWVAYLREFHSEHWSNVGSAQAVDTEIMAYAAEHDYVRMLTAEAYVFIADDARAVAAVRESIRMLLPCRISTFMWCRSPGCGPVPRLEPSRTRTDRLIDR